VNNFLAIVGASGHGKVVAEIAEALGYEVNFFDDASSEKCRVEHWTIKGDFQTLLDNKNKYFGAVVAIGHAPTRKKVSQSLLHNNILLPSLIHPKANVSKYARFAQGCVVMPSATINAFAEIGQGSIVNTSAVVEHHCKLGEYVHICPNSALAGGVIVGELSWIGIGTSVRQLIAIGSNVTVGAGSVVVKDIESGQTAFGNPAKIVIKE